MVVVADIFSYFHFFLYNQCANFNQTWHKASLGEEDSILFNFCSNEEPHLFQRGNNYEIAKIHLRN